MWFNLLSMGIKAGTHIYKNKQQTKMLMSDAQMRNASAMAKGEMEYKGKLLEANSNGWKDEFVLILVSSPVMLLIWSIFSEDPEIMIKVDRFFDLFNNMPMWYQALFIGVVSAIYGLKGADIMKKK